MATAGVKFVSVLGVVLFLSTLCYAPRPHPGYPVLDDYRIQPDAAAFRPSSDRRGTEVIPAWIKSGRDFAVENDWEFGVENACHMGCLYHLTIEGFDGASNYFGKYPGGSRCECYAKVPNADQIFRGIDPANLASLSIHRVVPVEKV